MESKKQCNPAPGQPLADYKTGVLPAEAPLAVPCVPMQKENPPQYSSEEGLTRGTIFPGLDLPWMNTVNKSNPAAGTAMGEVMALEFALDELQLYLDTHPKDREAQKMFAYYADLSKEARRNYEAKYGPLCRENALEDGHYAWLKNPWPWDYQERMD